jgi:hypothetical protein
MSPEIIQSVKPSLSTEGEGCQGWAMVNPARSGRDHNDGLSSHRHGGVGADGMWAQGLVLMEEICADGRQRPTAGTSDPRRKARPIGAEVGAVHSSNEPANPRGAKGPHLVNADGEAKDWR